MAVSSGTVQVVMPAMGDSVAEGTVLEWHKQEGDTIDLDETLVEISTDKVDAEVPAPAAGRLVKIHAAEGETVTVGALLAEIATDGAGNGAAPTPATGLGDPASEAAPAPGSHAAVQAAATEADAERQADVARNGGGSDAPAADAPGTPTDAGQIIDIVTPTGGESVTEGTILEWSV